MNQHIRFRDLPIVYLQHDHFSALGAGSFHVRLAVQGGGDTERVPGAVSKVGLPVYIYPEGCLNIRKREDLLC